MKSSNLTYKFLVFIIFNLAIFLILGKLIFEYFNYKKDFDSFKSKFEILKKKNQGKITNHLETPIFAFNKASYYNEINKILFPISFNKDSLIYLGTSKIEGSEKKEVNLFVKDSINYYNCKGSNFLMFKKEVNTLTNSLIFNGISLEKTILDDSINLRIRKINDFIFFDSFLMEKGEKVNFYYDPELNLRIYYDNSFSQYYIINLLNNFKKLESGLIRNPKLRKIDNKISIKLSEDLYYCIIYTFDLNNFKVSNYILYYLALYKIEDEKKRKIKDYVIKALQNNEFEIQNNKFLVKINDKTIYENITKYFFIPILLGNKKVFDFIEELNSCKRSASNCDLSKYYEMRDFPHIGKFSYLKKYFNVELIYELSKKEEFAKLIEEILEVIIFTNFLNPKDKLCLFDLKENNEICFNEVDTKKIKELTRKFKDENNVENFRNLVKEIEKLKEELVKNNKKNEIMKIIKNNKLTIKNELKGVYYFIKLEEVEDYLRNRVFIYPNQELYYFPSFILKVDKIIKEENKWVIKFK